MKTSVAVSIGIGIGLLGGALLLVTLPRVALPCDTTVTYTSKLYKPTIHKHQFVIIDVKKQKVLRGTGSFGPMSLACDVDLSRDVPM